MGRLLLAAVALGAACSAACGPAFPNGPSGEKGGSNMPTAADLAFCVSDINAYRAQANRPSLTESTALDTFAAQGAQIDGASGVAHSHFTSSNGGGIATSENELLALDLTVAPTIQAAMHAANATFWGEGPTGPHYQILVGPYLQVGCGAFTTNGAVTIVEDFQ